MGTDGIGPSASSLSERRSTNELRALGTRLTFCLRPFYIKSTTLNVITKHSLRKANIPLVRGMFYFKYQRLPCSRFLMSFRSNLSRLARQSKIHYGVNSFELPRPAQSPFRVERPTPQL